MVLTDFCLMVPIKTAEVVCGQLIFFLPSTGHTNSFFFFEEIKHCLLDTKRGGNLACVAREPDSQISHSP